MKALYTLLRQWANSSLVLRIFSGLLCGIFLGVVVPEWRAIAILGLIFVSLLKAIAPVLVAVLVMSSLSKARSSLGPRFRTVIFQYLLSTFIAASFAVVLSFLFPVRLILDNTFESQAPGALHDVFSNLVSNMVANPLLSIVNANYVGILFWAIIFGLALKKMASQQTIDMVHDFAETVSQAVKWVIQFAPFGILGLVYDTVSNNGLDVFSSYGHLLLILLGCMATTALVFNPLISFLMLRRNPYPLLFTCLKESGLNAFFTRSSAANIPINMNLCRKLGLDVDFYSISIPLGATINMDGAAVTITVLSLAVAHTVGVEVGLLSALFLCLISTLGACGASGVAGGSLLLVPMACSFLGISNDVAMQAVAIGFIIGVVQDSVETALNSSGDVFFTATAEYYERQKKELAEKE